MIIKGVTESSEEIQEMSAASEEMAASAETALESIEKTSAAAEDNLGYTRMIGQLAEEQMASVEEVNASIESLNKIVIEMEDAISYFKV